MCKSKSSCQIMEIETISAILPLVQDESYIFFDVDETLIIPKTNFVYGLSKCDEFIDAIKGQFRDNAELLNQILRKMEELYYKSDVVLVEDQLTRDTIDILKNERNCKVFGITSRGINEQYSELVLPHLMNFGIAFSKMNIHSDSLEMENGLIFTNHQNKGQTIINFLTSNFHIIFRK